MYRFVTRNTSVRQSAQSFTRRGFSNQAFRAQRVSRTNMFLGVGITMVPVLASISYWNDSRIHNEVDEGKIEKGKKEAEATGDEKKVEKAKKESIGKAKTKTKVPAEDANPETRTETGKGQEKSEDDENGSAAYDPETGEINWDCPCLGGMAHGPCGEEFKEAFACFVHSETEPKGIDCIKKFENMRNCFREHPEHYKEELYDDEEPEPVVDVSEKSQQEHDAPKQDKQKQDKQKQDKQKQNEQKESTKDTKAEAEADKTSKSN